MDTTILVCILSGAFTLLGTIVTVSAGQRKTEQSLITHNSLQDEKINNLYTSMNELKTEVHTNNELKIRVPVLEEKVKHLEEKVQMLENHGGH